MDTVQIKLYDIFRKDLNLPDDKAAAFVAVVEEVIELGVKKEGTSFSTKDDIHRLELKLEQTKSDIYKAMFWTGLVQLLAILGGVMAIVKFMK